MTEPALQSIEEAMKEFDPHNFRDALGCFATGVTVITAANGQEEWVGLTVNSFASVSLNPPMVLWSLSMFAPSLGVFQGATHFVVNVLAASQDELAMNFAGPSDDKFKGVKIRQGLGGAPVLEGAAATFECRNAFRYYGGDHLIFVGAVETYHHLRTEPLLFCHGTYGRFRPDQ